MTKRSPEDFGHDLESKRAKLPTFSESEGIYYSVLCQSEWHYPFVAAYELVYVIDSAFFPLGAFSCPVMLHKHDLHVSEEAGDVLPSLVVSGHVRGMSSSQVWRNGVKIISLFNTDLHCLFSLYYSTTLRKPYSWSIVRQTTSGVSKNTIKISCRGQNTQVDYIIKEITNINGRKITKRQTVKLTNTHKPDRQRDKITEMNTTQSNQGLNSHTRKQTNDRAGVEPGPEICICIAYHTDKC